jgi:hypothetical protein
MRGKELEVRPFITEDEEEGKKAWRGSKRGDIN